MFSAIASFQSRLDLGVLYLGDCLFVWICFSGGSKVFRLPRCPGTDSGELRCGQSGALEARRKLPERLWGLTRSSPFCLAFFGG